MTHQKMIALALGNKYGWRVQYTIVSNENKIMRKEMSKPVIFVKPSNMICTIIIVQCRELYTVQAHLTATNGAA